MMYEIRDLLNTYKNNYQFDYTIDNGELLGFLSRNVDLSNFITQEQLTNSFIRKQIIVFYDIIVDDTIIALHKFLSKSCCNIENFLLITRQTAGATVWWENYKKLFVVKSFTIHESPFFAGYIQRDMILSAKEFDRNKIKNTKKISKLFSYYGGTYSSFLSKEYALLKLLKYYNDSVTEYLGTFQSRQVIENYVEEITNFCNVNEVNDILLRYDMYVDPATQRLNYHPQISAFTSSKEKAEKIHNETRSIYISGVLDPETHPIVIKFGSGDTWNYNQQCFSSIIRETQIGNTFSTVTEKTISCFLHSMPPIPFSGSNTVLELENLGFSFNRSIIDYHYSNNLNISDRLIAIDDMLEKILQTYTYSDLQEHYIENFDSYNYNAEYLISGDYFAKTIQNLKNTLDAFLN